ncbi:hypothetical protein CPB83DRAFT_842772 [Crepidotus variabilis]|uniref:non-specific serine/threonine protein kinase n=1 Tax=Crepidotus variabilis TaxID=179855 RepID=A0A9P6JVN9_9AGAR|nr:hypothetical protein CPB83DRAFT_842772 [Crepidotus variabilis]
MLGARTKQINTYGKRAKRVIDASSASASSQTASNVEIISIFDDMPPPPPWKSVAAKMKNRENDMPARSKAPTPKVVGLQKKRRLSPVLSPVKKKQATRNTQLKEDEVPRTPARKRSQKIPQTPGTGRPDDPIILSASPPRAPLSSVRLNIPGSPVLPRKRGKTPARKKKPIPVPLDIIVLDDDGHTVSKERRVSKKEAEINPINRVSAGKRVGRTPSAPIIIDSDDENAPTLLQPRKRQTTKKKIVISDDSGSDDEVTRFGSPSTTSNGLKAQIEVVVPKPPYKIHPAPPREPTPPPLPSPLKPIDSPAPYHYTDSPILKARQLTPIKGNRRRLFEPPSPPSPTTPTDLDFSIDFSELNLGDSSINKSKDFEAPDHLRPLLLECRQEDCGPHNFSTFIESFPYDPILQSARQNDDLDMNFRKIGEASYSEVFGIGDVVLKVIPLRDETKTHQPDLEDGPAPSDAHDVRKEIIVTRAMGDVYGGYVKLLKTYVVRGRYPEVLLRLWDEYNERKGSESCRPDSFTLSQVYAIIVLPNGGPDLEAYRFRNAGKTGWRQACSLFWQVTKSLAHAEHLVSFEHRDLHWGQILVKNLPYQSNALRTLNPNQRSKPQGERIYMDDLSHGVQATVIDLGLSRMDAGDSTDGACVHWTPFDEEVFMGEGDYQFDVYRMMKILTQESWEDFHPITNVLWLHYLLRKLLQSKGLKPPAIRKQKGSEAALSQPAITGTFTEKDCYDTLVDIEEWLNKTISELVPSGGKLPAKGKGRRKTQATSKNSSSGPARAGELVAYGVKKGWIKSSVLF